VSIGTRSSASTRRASRIRWKCGRFSPVWVSKPSTGIKSTARPTKLDTVEAAVDETPLGTFVELEGLPDDVDRAAAALGARPEDFIRASYRELQENEAAARGVFAGRPAAALHSAVRN
jgi:hypothetical protein